MVKHLYTLALLFVVLSLGIAYAADEAKKPQDAKALMVELRIKSWNKELNFTEEQKNKIRPLIAAENEAVAKVRADESLSVTDKGVKHKALQQETYAKITPLLNEEQAAKWKEMVARFSKTKTPSKAAQDKSSSKPAEKPAAK